jgi:BirA family biotin operon repressor/biotin-[acetyl-CoA-carboxylase] ligase
MAQLSGEPVLPPDLTPDAITARLRGAFGHPLRCFASISSTNPEAMDWAVSGAPEGAVVVADHQTAGRGRGSRSWASAPGAALQFSLVLRPDAAPERLGLMTTALGLACIEAVAAVSGVQARLKWPNDVVVGERKLSGCLVETKLAQGRVMVAVAGMGINVGPDGLPPEVSDVATSVGAEAGEVPPRAELLGEVLARFESIYPLVGGPGAGALVRRAEAASDLIGGEVEILLPDGGVQRGTARGLDALGALLVETPAGRRAFHTGDVTRIRRSG